MWKVLAVVLLLAVAAHARPPKGGKGGDKPEDKGAALFMKLVKLCMRVEEQAIANDKRDWSAIFGQFFEICMGVKNALAKEMDNSDMADRSLGVTPDSLPQSGDLSGLGDMDGKSGKSGKGGRGGRGDKGGRGGKDKDSADLDRSLGVTPDSLPQSVDLSGLGDMDGKSGKSGKGGRGGRGGKSKDSADLERSLGVTPDSRPMDKSRPSLPESLVMLCAELAEFGEEMAKKQDKRSQDELEQILQGMVAVCTAAFDEVNNSD